MFRGGVHRAFVGGVHQIPTKEKTKKRFEVVMGGVMFVYTNHMTHDK